MGYDCRHESQSHGGPSLTALGVEDHMRVWIVNFDYHPFFCHIISGQKQSDNVDEFLHFKSIFCKILIE